jgi:hypothetical protein
MNALDKSEDAEIVSSHKVKKNKVITTVVAFQSKHLLPFEQQEQARQKKWLVKTYLIFW